MSDIKIVNLDRSSRHDLWHGGEQDTTHPALLFISSANIWKNCITTRRQMNIINSANTKNPVSKASLNSVIWTAKSMDDVVHAPASAR